MGKAIVTFNKTHVVMSDPKMVFGAVHIPEQVCVVFVAQKLSALVRAIKALDTVADCSLGDNSMSITADAATAARLISASKTERNRWLMSLVPKINEIIEAKLRPVPQHKSHRLAS